MKKVLRNILKAIIAVSFVSMNLTGCEQPVIKPSVSPPSSPSIINSASPSVIPSASQSPVIQPSNGQGSIPNECIIDSPEEIQKAFNGGLSKVEGKIFRADGEVMPNVSVSLKLLFKHGTNIIEKETFTREEYIKEYEFDFKSECSLNKFNLRTKTDDNGYYNFPNLPSSLGISLNYEKKGFSTRQIRAILHGNISDPCLNVFSIGNPKVKSSHYLDNCSFIGSLRNEPEISKVKINNNEIGIIDISILSEEEKKLISINKNIIPKDFIYPRLTLPSINNVEIELTFSEPIERSSLENNFQIRNYEQGDIITGLTNGSKFIWNGDLTKVIFNAPIAKKGKYIIEFKNPFKDTEGKFHIDNEYFRLITAWYSVLDQISQNIVFEIK